MLDPDIFPELDRFKVEDGVCNIIEGYSFIERVLLYRSLKSQGSYSHVLVYIIPNKEFLIKIKDPGCRALTSFEYGFKTHAGLDEVFRDAVLHGNGYQCVGVEASSEKDEVLKPYIVDGSNHWVLYEKYPQRTDDNKEIKTVQDIGKIGGRKSKRNVVLDEALVHLFKKEPHRRENSATLLWKYFKKNHGQDNPLCVKSGDVYFKIDAVEEALITENDSGNSLEKPVSRDTFDRYVSEIKKLLR